MIQDKTYREPLVIQPDDGLDGAEHTTLLKPAC